MRRQWYDTVVPCLETCKLGKDRRRSGPSFFYATTRDSISALPCPAVSRLVAMPMTAMRERLSGPTQALQARFTTGGVRFIGTRLFGFHIEVSGRENVPAGQSLIVAG